jgi:DNA replication protein DnaC
MEQLPRPVREAAESLPDDRGLLLWGPPGVGKTYSLCAIGHRLYFSGWDVARIGFEMLALQIRDNFKPGAARTELDVLGPLIAVDKLILEDVGTTVGVGKVESDFSLRTFLVLLDTRLEHCRATYISSNKSIEEIGKSFDQRIASRLQQACEVIKLEGRDKRSVGDAGASAAHQGGGRVNYRQAE